MHQPIRLLIIHRSRLLREGLAASLRARGFSVVATGSELSAVENTFDELRPGVAILDLGVPGREGLAEARRLRELLPETRVIMIGLTDLESDFVAAVEVGINGCVRESAGLDELIEQLPVVAAGQAWCTSRQTALLFSLVARRSSERRREWIPQLTRREHQIVGLIEEGLTNKEIGESLGIAIQTVKNHIHNILDKLQLDNRHALIRYARDVGLLAAGGSQSPSDSKASGTGS